MIRNTAETEEEGDHYVDVRRVDSSLRRGDTFCNVWCTPTTSCHLSSGMGAECYCHHCIELPLFREFPVPMGPNSQAVWMPTDDAPGAPTTRTALCHCGTHTRPPTNVNREYELMKTRKIKAGPHIDGSRSGRDGRKGAKGCGSAADHRRLGAKPLTELVTCPGCQLGFPNS